MTTAHHASRNSSLACRHLARMGWASLLFTAALMFPAIPVLAQSSAADGPMVSIPGGEIRGRADTDSDIFLSIPYAAPPLGALRWQPPRAVVPWQGVREANRDGASCLQNDEGWNHADWLRASEDCLTLSIRTPDRTLGRSGAQLPVMVWIHGGSNRAGSGFGAVESTFAEHGVVAVSVQYRLGILGFLAHRGLADEQGGSAGNYGLMDQIAALRWVHDNIAKFGGDPRNVTIFGESAGAQDVSLLLAAPSARGLFRAAIMQSGTPGFGMSFRPLEEALAIGDQLDRLAGSNGDISKLRALSPLALFALQNQLSEPAAHGNDYLFLRTTIDGAVLPKAPDQLLAERPALPVIIGTNRIEFGPPPGAAPMGEFSRYWFGSKAEGALAAYQDEEAAGPDPRRGNIELRMQTDAQFHCPANRLTILLAARGWPVWRYEFDLAPDGGQTRHALDVGYVFSGKMVGSGARMQDYWLGLAKGQDPNSSGNSGPRWLPITGKNHRILQFNRDATVMAPGLPRDAFCGFGTAW